MSYWNDETARLEDLIRKALAAKNISEAKYLLRHRNAHRVPTSVEWIDNGLLPTGMMFREMVRGKDEEGLKHEFWMTLEEAQHMLACVELATLPAWDAIALLEAITLGWEERDNLSYSGLSKRQIERRIALAQSSGQLTSSFRALDGLAWAERMGLEIPDRVLVEAVMKISPHFDGSFEERWQAWCTTKEAERLESSGSMADDPEEDSPKFRDKLREQERVIIAWLRASNLDPKNLPYVANGFPGARSKARIALDRREPFEATTAFGKAWQRLRDDGEIKEQKKER